MSFFRHVRSIGPMWLLAWQKAEPPCRLPLVGPGGCSRGATEIAPPLIVRDESHRLFLGGLLSSRARLRFTGCVHFAMKDNCRSRDFQRTANSGLTGCLSPGVHRRCFVMNHAILQAVSRSRGSLTRKRSTSSESRMPVWGPPGARHIR